MASIAITLFGALVSAAAFTGGGVLARKLEGGNTDEERKRHDLAIEQLQRANDAYYAKRAKLNDWYARQKDIKEEASRKLIDTDDALRFYAKVNKQEFDLGPEPKLEDFYTPSKPQKKGEMIFVAGSALAIGGLVAAYVV